MADSRLNNFVAGGQGTPGAYMLNQKVSKFADRRTRRNRDRSTINRKAVQESTREN